MQRKSGPKKKTGNKKKAESSYKPGRGTSEKGRNKSVDRHTAKTWGFSIDGGVTKSDRGQKRHTRKKVSRKKKENNKRKKIKGRTLLKRQRNPWVKPGEKSKKKGGGGAEVPIGDNRLGGKTKTQGVLMTERESKITFKGQKKRCNVKKRLWGERARCQ